MNRHVVVVVGLLLVAAVLAVVELEHRDAPAKPDHKPAAGLTLKGLWRGPEASADAAKFAGLCRGMVEAMRVDDRRTAPKITTGVSLEELRITAAEGRFLPRRLTEEQPHAMAAVKAYLDAVVGTSGGKLDAPRKAAWLSAFMALADAAEESIR